MDSAEIPTAQELQTLAPDGTPNPEQLDAAAQTQCADLASEITASVDGAPVSWEIRSSILESVPGAAGLPTLRLSCQLRAAADLGEPRTIELVDGYRDDRVGWHEITADGSGVRLLDPPVGSTSASDELRSYPTDLLSSPLDQRSVELRTEPGQNTGADSHLTTSSGDPFSSFIASMDRVLEDLIGGELTLLVGTLAVVLAVVLGAGHALLPGHGKTMIAAYLAVRRGRSRDAVLVGATVTATHTAGVLLLGLAISLSSNLAGEQVLRWLGIISGLLVTGIGLFMLRTALRGRRPFQHRAPDRTEAAQPSALVGAAPGSAAAADSTEAEHGHHHHDHGPEGHEHAHEQGGHDHADHEHGHDHADHDHAGPHGHTHGESWWAGGHAHEPAVGRGGLIGMGVAGGLVPSPSALIVLVASIALGRTVFGVFLVVAYGLGMAGTLTVAGLLLVRLRGRLDRRAARTERGRGRSRWATVAAILPVLTAALVLLVGVGLVVRGLLLTG